MPTKLSSAGRVFTTEKVLFPGTVHIGEDKDFRPPIQKALELGGYAEDMEFTGVNGGKQVTTGFGHHAILSNADEVVAAVKSGAIRHMLYFTTKISGNTIFLSVQQNDIVVGFIARKGGKPINGEHSTTAKAEKLPNNKKLAQKLEKHQLEKAEYEVNRMQTRIAQAILNQNWNAVKRLQYLLTLSYYAKLLVIRKVTTHKGKELLVWARFYRQLRRVRYALSFRTYLEKLSYIKLRYYIFQL